MTIILIHNDPEIRAMCLVEWVNQLMNKEHQDLLELFSNPDIHFIKNPIKVSIKIDEVKQLQRELVYKPFQGNAQIGVIFDAHMLTTEAQNALLKALEEQNDETHYILLTANEKDLLPTILSRGKKYYPKADKYITLDNNSEPSLEGALIPLLDNDLVSAFKYIEELVEGEKEEKGLIDRALHIIEIHIQNSLQLSIKNDELIHIQILLNKLTAIQTARKRLNANVNKRLLLENLVLQLQTE